MKIAIQLNREPEKACTRGPWNGYFVTDGRLHCFIKWSTIKWTILLNSTWDLFPIFQSKSLPKVQLTIESIIYHMITENLLFSSLFLNLNLSTWLICFIFLFFRVNWETLQMSYEITNSPHALHSAWYDMINHESLINHTSLGRHIDKLLSVHYRNLTIYITSYKLNFN